MTQKNVDVIVIGAGPNGLVLGAYLSKAGLKVLVLERRHEMGGGLMTEAVTAPGYLHNTPPST
jgi:phytoene dehydrogenase-like protein